MKKLNIVLVIVAISIAMTSCSDNGPVSADQKDALVSQSISTANVENQPPTYSIPINPSHIGAENPGFSDPPGECPTPPAGQEGWWGWHFVMPGTGDFTALSVTFQNAGSFFADPFPGDPPVFVAEPHNSHAYIWTPTPDVLTAATANATVNPSGGQFVLSHVCEGEVGESLEVSKTVVTTYNRAHDWSIDKSVDTDNGLELDDFAKIWLYTDGSGDESAEWTVEVTYEGYEDSGWNVSGEITITNIGTSAKLIDSVVDELAGTEIAIECSVNDVGISFPYTLDVDGVISCTYSEDGFVEGDNVVTVTVDADENDPFSPYSDTQPIVWGDPENETNAVVDVKDISDLFGTVNLGTLDAADYDDGDTIPFTYDKSFAWFDYGAESCGGFRYDNTAEVIGDEDEVLDSADAALKVNVQCFVYESAWAKGDPSDAFCDNGFNNWGWSNPVSPDTFNYEMDLWAGAGQCDTSKGTLVGKVIINYNGGFDYEYDLFPGHSLKEYHVYAGSTMFPQQARGRNGFVNTTAPGQYYISNPLTGDIYVIAHGVVGLPDPGFGPN